MLQDSTPLRLVVHLYALKRGAASLVVGLLATLIVANAALAQANPAALQIYFMPLTEADALASMKATNVRAEPPVFTYVSVSIGTNATLVYYDQWENGYDADIANPTDLFAPGNPDGTQIWGNGRAADGCAPNIDGKTPLACSDANDQLASGNVVVLANAVNPATTQTVIDFDGGDKIGTTKQIAVSRLYWPNVPRTLLAGAIELLPTNKWGTSYISPVGEDNNYNSMFQYTSMAVMAFQPNTAVAIDVNGPAAGGAVNFVLQTGQSRVVNNIFEAATLDASLPVQVHLLTADRDSSYEHSAYTLVPVSAWSSRLFTPVGVVRTGVSPTRRTQITLFNPGAFPLEVECIFRNGGDATVVVPSRSTNIVAVPDRSGAECRAVNPLGQEFFAISTVDAAGVQGGAGETWDWGSTLVPESQLTPQALVGPGLGRDPTSTVSPNQNGSPVWVSPFCGLSKLFNYIFVDLDGNGVPDKVDLNGDGDTTDVVDGVNEATSNTGMQVGTNVSIRIFDPVDRDQTGLLVSTRRVPDYNSQEFGCNIAVVWGEDPTVASQGEPGFDVGTSVPPIASLVSVKKGTLEIDADNDGYVTRGDTLRYQIVIENAGIAPIATVTVSDTVPGLTTYVTSTTTLDLGSGPVARPDDSPPRTPFPVDEGGILLGTNMPPGAVWILSYLIRINTQDPAPDVCSEFVISNTAIVNGEGETEEVPGFEPVECAGTLVLEKVALGPGPVPSFLYTATAEFLQGGPNNELPSSGTLSPAPFGSQAVTYSVPTGLFTITEALTPGWTLIDIGCEGTGIGDLDARRALYLITGDDLVKCTFTNTVPSKVVIAKETLPSLDPTRFFFSFVAERDIENPEVPGEPVPVPPLLIAPVLQGGEAVTIPVIAGTYFATETVPAGWQLTDITCTAGGTTNPAGNAARITVTPGQVERCTFTNTKDGLIILRKVTNPPNDPQLFSFSGALTGTIGHLGILTRTVAPGTYTVVEAVPPGWGTERLLCNDSDSGNVGGNVQYIAAPGETVTCVVGNVRLARVGDRAWNDLNQNGVQESGEPGFAGVRVRLFRVDPPPAVPAGGGSPAAVAADVLVGTQTTNASGNYLFVDLRPALYYLDFDPPAGYLVSPQNAGTDATLDSDIDPTGRTLNFTLPAGAADLTRDAGFFLVPTNDPGQAEPGRPIYLPVVR